jgi:hypothetical protein
MQEDEEDVPLTPLDLEEFLDTDNSLDFENNNYTEED